jgi:ABC-2 type transport system ATP-binding protein
MRCELAAALIHRPSVLFLDEPTIGLDVTMQATMRRFIRQYNERHGATIILTSHNMDDVAALCPRVVVIDKGKLSYDGTLDSLVEHIRPEKRVVLRLSEPAARAALEGLERVIACEPERIVLHVPSADVRAVVARALAQLPIDDLTIESAPLDDVVSELFARTKAARTTGQVAS